jgi:hypothetical protein
MLIFVNPSTLKNKRAYYIHVCETVLLCYVPEYGHQKVQQCPCQTSPSGRRHLEGVKHLITNMKIKENKYYQ